MSWISPFLFLTIDARSVLFMSKQNVALNHFVGRQNKHFLCQLLKKCIPFFNFTGHREKYDQTKAGALFSLVWALYQLLRRNKNKNKMIKQEIGFIPTLKNIGFICFHFLYQEPGSCYWTGLKVWSQTQQCGCLAYPGKKI